jgi:hypothetical protein
MMAVLRSSTMRLARAALRALFLICGLLACLLGVMFGVGLGFSTVSVTAEGPLSVATGVLLLLVDAAFCAVGLLTLVSALEDWDPPYNHWQGIRWNIIGATGSVIIGGCLAVIAVLNLRG